MSKYKFTNIMGYKVYSDNLYEIQIDSDRKKIINTINPHSYITAKKDKAFKDALLASDILLPDGCGIVLAAKQIQKESIQKIAGADLHMYLLDVLNKSGGSVFYMGASQKTLDAIHERVAKEYPNVRSGSYSPPFKPQFSKDDNETIISKVNAFDPDVLFIGMTAPKQEKWLNEFKDKLNFKVASSIGAVFDFYAGTVRRPSQFWLNHHLEWFLRLLKEPRHLWQRTFVSAPKFLFDIILFKIKG